MKKVLLIEDDIHLYTHLQERLSEEGYEVLVKTDGESGLKLASEWKPDLLVLDLMLPLLDGYSVCRAIRINKKLGDVRILILSARGTEVDKIVALETGADDYMVKPVRIGELLARMRALLRRRQKEVLSSILTSGPIVLYVESHKVEIDGKEVSFSLKEFLILAELMRNKGIILSRDLIYTKVWGDDAFVDRRTVDVHIRWIRQKIEEDPSIPNRILTVRGSGYRFEE